MQLDTDTQCDEYAHNAAKELRRRIGPRQTACHEDNQHQGDNRSIYAAGADKRIRAWELLSREAPKINPLHLSRMNLV